MKKFWNNVFCVQSFNLSLKLITFWLRIACYNFCFIVILLINKLKSLMGTLRSSVVDSRTIVSQKIGCHHDIKWIKGNRLLFSFIRYLWKQVEKFKVFHSFSIKLFLQAFNPRPLFLFSFVLPSNSFRLNWKSLIRGSCSSCFGQFHNSFLFCNFT